MRYHITNRYLFGSIGRGILGMVIAPVAMLLLLIGLAQPALADDAALPVVTLPSVCMVEGESDATLDEGGAEDTIAAPLAVTTTAYTATPTLTWQWQTPVYTDETIHNAGYGYALYADELLRESGELAPDTLQYSYDASDDAVYRLYVWSLQALDDETTQPIECAQADSVLDTQPPQLSGEGYTQDGAVAMPAVTTNEVDVVYQWSMDADASMVLISDATTLVPQFTFLHDGTYTATLTATDRAGNSALWQVTMTYQAPEVPPIDGNTPPVLEAIDPTPPPAPRAPIISTSQPTPLIDELVADPVTYVAAASDNQYVAAISDEAPPTKDAGVPAVDTVLTPSPQGWILFGVPWYWWVLLAASIATAWRWYSTVHRGGTEPDDI